MSFNNVSKWLSQISPASSVRGGNVSAGKRKRSMSHSPTRELRLWNGCGPTRALTEWTMKDMKDFPLSVSVDNILSAYGSRARCWGEACSWLEKYPARVDELDLLKMSEEFWHGAILFFRRRLDSGSSSSLSPSPGRTSDKRDQASPKRLKRSPAPSPTSDGRDPASSTKEPDQERSEGHGAIPTGFAALRGSLNTTLRKNDRVTAAGQQAGPSTNGPAQGLGESHQTTILSSPVETSFAHQSDTSFPHHSETTPYRHHWW